VIIDGKKIAHEVIETLLLERSLLGELTLGVVMNEGDAASQSYVEIKERTAEKLQVKLRRFSVEEFDEALKCTGVIVQLPLEGSEKLIAKLPPDKDVDALNPATKFVRPPVAEAVSEIFMRHDIAAQGKKAVVVGAGQLVGVPAADLLKELGAQVEVITKNDGSLLSLKDADIVILGAGDPHFVKPDMLKEGAVLIDAGTSESGGRVVGDADPACAEACSVFTPVPGGVGPIAVAMLFRNLFVLAKAQK
jgi:methylenetetrahydrofolate dehydrogenase (NADP+)/methenyltetrahydrofolate cyclohydrolase